MSPTTNSPLPKIPTLSSNKLREIQEAASVLLAQQELGEFAIRMNPRLQLQPFHAYICEHMEALERGDIRNLIVAVPPRHGKPLAVETPVLMADGSYRPLGQVEVGDRVITRNGRPGMVRAVHEQGVLPVLKITTHGGRSVRAALDHPFLTTDGWKKAADLVVGDTLGCVDRPQTVSTEDRAAHEFRLAGYFIGDGNVTRGTTSFNARITNIDPAILADIKYCATLMRFSANEAKRNGHNRATSLLLAGGVREWLTNRGLAGHDAHTKRVPEWVFRAGSDMIANFIGAYFSCDGCVSGKGFVKGRRDVAVEFYSIQRPLLEDVQHLLLRLGIQSRLRTKWITYKGERKPSYVLTLTSMNDVAKFRDRIPVYGAKADRLSIADVRRTQFDADLLPDAIAEIEPDGEADCRCLTLGQADDPSFTANDLVVHNTELVSINFPAWVLGRDPNAKIILASYNLELALRNSRMARNKLLEPTWPFPNVSLATDSMAAQRWGTTAGGEVLATGVGAGITGFGADYLLIDDPFKGREEADSERERNRVWNWYREDASTRQMPRGRTVVMATRWHEDDLIGRILNQEGALNEWVVISLPALAEENDQIGRAYGEPLDPVRYPVEELLRLQARVGSRGWSALYQQRPTPAQGDLIKREWWQHYDYADLKRKGLRPSIMAVDPAFGSGSGNDYSAVAIWGTLGGRYYLIDLWRKRVTYPELRQAIGDLYRKWRVPALIEDIGAGRILINEMRSGAYRREDNIAVPTLPFKLPAISTATGGRMLGKRQRVEMISNFIEGGLVFIPEVAPWLSSFIEEHSDFPAGTHDDMVDTTVMALMRLSTVRDEIKGLFTGSSTIRFGVL